MEWIKSKVTKNVFDLKKTDLPEKIKKSLKVVKKYINEAKKYEKWLEMPDYNGYFQEELEDAIPNLYTQAENEIKKVFNFFLLS